MPFVLLAMLLFVADSRPKSEIERELRIARVEVDEIRFEWFPKTNNGPIKPQLLFVQHGADALKTIQSLGSDSRYGRASHHWETRSDKQLKLQFYSHHKKVASITLVGKSNFYEILENPFGMSDTMPETQIYINDLMRPFGHQL